MEKLKEKTSHKKEEIQKNKIKKAIIFVESPGKCGTIRKYLSQSKEVNYDVVATVGHIAQLPSQNGSVTVKDDKVQFLWIDKGDNVKNLTKIIEDSAYDEYYIATDPDREGEGIAYHTYKLLVKLGVDDKKIWRIVFNEITKSAIEASIKKPGAINYSLVYAYFARLAIDYLIGYILSPLAWKLGKNYSVGRVQTCGLKVIIEKEEEILNFIEELYHMVYGLFNGLDLTPKLIEFKEQDINRITDAKQLEDIKVTLNKAENKTYTVTSITEKDVHRAPSAPFATATLQQEAASKLGLSVSLTMSNAQKLYEEGLITYMRTDSITISDEAITAVRSYINNNFGSEYLHPTIVEYKTKIKNAQEAHEAIRPTDINNSGDSIENEYHRKLYQLIWKRTVACQMSNAIYKKKDIILSNGISKMSLTGSQLKFLGYLKVYGREEDEDALLPDLELNSVFTLNELKVEEHKTKHSPRYTEGGLVKFLQKKGIGRPSTYGLIIEILKKRDYVKLSQKTMFGSMRGKILISFMEVFLQKYIDYNFTAKMEEELDKIANGELDWNDFVVKFYNNLYNDIQEVSKMQLFAMLDQVNPVLQKWIKNAPCEKCGHKYSLYIKSSLFFFCTNCKNILAIRDSFDFKEDKDQEESGEEKPKFYKKATKKVTKKATIKKQA